MIEVERKYRLAAGQQEDIRAKMDDMGEVETVSQADAVFLRGARSFAEFTKGDPVVRIRTTNNNTTLTVKRAHSKEGDTIEHEVAVDSAAEARGIVTELGFEPVTDIKKDRSTVADGRLKVMLDNVAGLGYFVELEVVVPNEQEVSAATEEIERRAEALGLAEAQLESRKYDELLEIAQR